MRLRTLALATGLNVLPILGCLLAPDLDSLRGGHANAVEAGVADAPLDDGATMLPPIDAVSPNDCLAPDAGPLLVAHSTYGFRTVQGGCGWSYGTVNPAEGKVSLFASTDAKDLWPAVGVIPGVSASSQHPGPTTRAVRRFVSTVNGSVRVEARARIDDPTSNAIGGNGVDVLVLVGTKTLFAQTLTGSMTAVIDLEVDVVKGMAIDFEVDARDGNASYDSTSYVVVISLAPP